MSDIITIKRISQFHQIAELSDPKHPLIGVYEVEDMQAQSKPESMDYEGMKISTDMYTIMFKDKIRGTINWIYNQNFINQEQTQPSLIERPN